MIAVTVLLIGACVVALRLVPPDSLERRLADRDLDREPAYAINVPGYTPWRDRGFAHIGDCASFNNVGSATIRLDVKNAAPDTVCAETTACTPDGPDLTYVRTEHSHGYVVRRGRVNVRGMGLASADGALLRQAALSAYPATDDELLRALPPWKPDRAVERFHQWLHSF